MSALVQIRRFFTPRLIGTIFHFFRSGGLVSFKAEVEISRKLFIGRGARVSAFAKIKASEGRVTIGARTDIGCGAFIGGHSSGIEIGEDCLISPHVSIIGVNYRFDRADMTMREQGVFSRGATVIGNNVWIGAGAVILDNTKIGDGAIIGPNAVVSGKIPPLAVVQGNPGKVIFTRR